MSYQELSVTVYEDCPVIVLNLSRVKRLESRLQLSNFILMSMLVARILIEGRFDRRAKLNLRYYELNFIFKQMQISNKSNARVQNNPLSKQHVITVHKEG